MRKIIFIFILWLVFLNAINKISSEILPDSTSYELPKNSIVNFRFWLAPWLNFDGREYLEIVNRGYVVKKGLDLRLFFPLYPFFIRVMSFNLFINPVLVGLGISSLTFMASLFLFDKLLLQDKLKKEERDKNILLLLLFPTSFFFLAYYTESLFLLLALLVFYLLNKNNLFLASLITSFATATRIFGLALIPALLWEGYKSYKKTKKIPWSILISPLGFILFVLFTQFTTGNAMSIVSKHQNVSGAIGFLGIWNSIKEGLLKVFFGSPISRHNSVVYSIEFLEFLSGIFLLTFLIRSFRKIKPSYWFYSFFCTLLILFSGTLSSAPRYILIVFPIYIYLAKTLSKKYFHVVCFLFFLLLIFLSARFLRGYWVA